MLEGGFWIGIHRHSLCTHFPKVCVSVNTLRNRRKPFLVNDWMMDSGAFSELLIHGKYRHKPLWYTQKIKYWNNRSSVVGGSLKFAVTQDYMCEDIILAKTGLTIRNHQKLTIERYDEILSLSPHTYIMPVLQGYQTHEYLAHLEMYGNRLIDSMYVGIGSICKRNSSPDKIYDILRSIKLARPDLRLHGFGLKSTALADEHVIEYLYSCDSMAWSRAARYRGRDTNGLVEAQEFYRKIQGIISRYTLSPRKVMQ